MLEHVKASDESTGVSNTFNRNVDPHRSVLNVVEEIKSVKSSKLSGSNPMSSTHNIILDTVMLEVEKNTTDFAASTTNLFVQFGRPDYGEKKNKIDQFYTYPGCMSILYFTFKVKKM